MSKVKKIFTIFSDGAVAPKVATEAIQRQEALIREQENRLKEQEAAAKMAEDERKKKEAATAAARRGRSSGSSLLSGLETGIQPVESGTRTTLG
jgi:hypothetical protein